MSIIDIADQLEVKRHAQWWKKVTNILRVMNTFKRECELISEMVNAHGDKDELASSLIYSGIDEYFCEEPNIIESDIFDEDKLKGLAPGKYIMILEVIEEVEDERFYKSGRLTYMKKRVGEPV